MIGLDEIVYLLLNTISERHISKCRTHLALLGVKNLSLQFIVSVKL